MLLTRICAKGMHWVWSMTQKGFDVASLSNGIRYLEGLVHWCQAYKLRTMHDGTSSGLCKVSWNPHPAHWPKNKSDFHLLTHCDNWAFLRIFSATLNHCPFSLSCAGHQTIATLPGILFVMRLDDLHAWSSRKAIMTCWWNYHSHLCCESVCISAAIGAYAR